MLLQPPYNPIITQDGTPTYYNVEYGENYHSLVGAKTEAFYKFIYPSGIVKAKQPQLLDIGFGLGYNAFYSFLTCTHIDILSLEKDENLIYQLENLYLESEIQTMISSLQKQSCYSVSNKKITICYGDARNSVKQLRNQSLDFSHIFLDAFSPSVNPELWTLDFFQDLYFLLQTDGVLITYSSSMAVLSALQRVGFFIFHTPNIGRKRGGIIAFKTEKYRELELIGAKDSFIIEHSVQAIPNRDKGSWSKEQIQLYRKKTQEVAVRLGFYLPHKRVLKLWKQKESYNG